MYTEKEFQEALELMKPDDSQDSLVERVKDYLLRTIN